MQNSCFVNSVEKSCKLLLWSSTEINYDWMYCDQWEMAQVWWCHTQEGSHRSTLTE